MTIAVLFDLEDTLIQTPWSNWQHVLEFRRKTREQLMDLGIPHSVLEGIERATIMRNKAVEHIEKNFTRVEAEKFHQELSKFFSQYELESAKKSKLLPETIPTLEKLRKIGARIGLVTNTSSKAVEIAFQLHGLEKYFDIVVTREKVKKLKPDPEGVLLAAKTLGVKRFCMVGDLVFDVLAARNANGVSIFVKGSFQEKIDPPADYIVRSLSEIPAIVKREMEKS
ncbi:MAG: HAD family hydrolase [Candidatus Bathyarchaeota archaeon]|nr:HAD family hydrolase [Candidatus Bathyarchaeota archaeon]